MTDLSSSNQLVGSHDSHGSYVTAEKAAAQICQIVSHFLDCLFCFRGRGGGGAKSATGVSVCVCKCVGVSVESSHLIYPKMGDLENDTNGASPTLCIYLYNIYVYITQGGVVWGDGSTQRAWCAMTSISACLKWMASQTFDKHMLARVEALHFALVSKILKVT